MVSIPVLHLPRVYHVGSLDPARRGELHRTSQEGPCLSVSLCPESWAGIARLGGDLHVLEREDAAYVDVTTLLLDEEAADVVLSWAANEGLIERTAMWRAWQYDDESDEWRFFLCATREEAEAEIDGLEVGPDGGEPVDGIDAWAPTGLLSARLGCKASDPAFARDFAAMVWVRDVAPDLLGCRIDGIWFTETFDPANDSAPRGGIFPDAVAGFSVSQVDWTAVCDVTELGGMPEPVTHVLPAVHASCVAPTA